MSDEELRRLERAVAAGDLEAKKALLIGYCRLGKHTYPGSVYGKDLRHCLGCGIAQDFQVA